MSGMTESELSRVEHFQIGQYGMGSVTWPGLSDVRYLNIDEIIIFKKGSVTLFPDEDLKPPEGTGLNKTAIIELSVKPKNSELAKKYESRYVSEMKKLTENNGAEFLSYDLETWRFRVEHFSTWGINEMEWDRIDLGNDTTSGLAAAKRNDLSLFSRIENEFDSEGNRDDVLINTDDDLVDQSPRNGGDRSPTGQLYGRSDFIGALAVPPPSREELKKMGWDLKVCDLFLNQSFRVSFGPNGSVVFPEHPVVVDTFNVTSAAVTTATNSHDRELLRTLITEKNSISVDALTRNCNPSHKSVFTLIDALMGEDESTENGNINTKKFNNWLSTINADKIKSRGKAAFSPACAMTSHDYSPSASELLVANGNPRLALAVAAASNETSRRLMKPEFEGLNVDGDIGDVNRILGGNVARVSESTAPDWRSQLALRYWYGEGDLTGFEPPNDSLEWRIIKSVVIGNTDQLVELVDMSPSSICLILATAVLIRAKNPDLVSVEHFNRIVRICSDSLISNGEWDWSVMCLSLLPPCAQRDNLMYDIVARNIDKDCSLIEEFKLISSDKLSAARSIFPK